MFKRYFSIDGENYSPSSGESAMLMLQKELEEDKDVYILDEPERSLGNDYINDVIVPLLKEKARAGKKVFISTHDANIAVRTLPYSSIYRYHGPGGYGTYVGNPFSNNLANVQDSNDFMDWKNVSMRTLEGGVEAFGERGKNLWKQLTPQLLRLMENTPSKSGRRRVSSSRCQKMTQLR